MIVSGCGLREGLFSQYLHQHTSKPLITPDILDTARENMIHLYSPDEDHCRLVAKYALQLFDGWQSLHRLDPKNGSPGGNRRTAP